MVATPTPAISKAAAAGRMLRLFMCRRSPRNPCPSATARLRRFGEHRAARFVRTAHSAGKSKARHRGNPLLLPRLWQRGDRRSQELPMDTSKRGLITGAAGVGAAFLLPTMPAFATRKKSAGGKKPAEKEDVTPPE